MSVTPDVALIESIRLTGIQIERQERDIKNYPRTLPEMHEKLEALYLTYGRLTYELAVFEKNNPKPTLIQRISRSKK